MIHYTACHAEFADMIFTMEKMGVENILFEDQINVSIRLKSLELIIVTVTNNACTLHNISSSLKVLLKKDRQELKRKREASILVTKTCYPCLQRKSIKKKNRAWSQKQ